MPLDVRSTEFRHLYLRLLPDLAQDNGSQTEVDQLLRAMRVAPGVLRVKEIKNHLKGGYSVSLDIETDAIEKILERVICLAIGRSYNVQQVARHGHAAPGCRFAAPAACRIAPTLCRTGSHSRTTSAIKIAK